MPAMSALGRALLLAFAGLLAGCDSENVSWVFVSNPGGSFPGPSGGAVIIIRVSSSSADAAANQSFVRVTGDDDGPVTVNLAVGAELAILERARSLEIRTPVLAADSVDLPGAIANFAPSAGLAVEIRVLDAAKVDPAAANGPGRILCAAQGTLVALEHAGGVIAFGGESPTYLPAGTTVEDRDGALFARLPDDRLQRLAVVPAPATAQRVRRPAAGQLELIGPRDTVIAALPESQCVLHDGADGLFLTASFPDGIGDDPTPSALTSAAGNRYLLQVLGSSAR